MDCYMHPAQEATAYCRSCGRPLCASCQRVAQGVIYCEEHAQPAAPQTPQSVQAPRPSVSPGLAFLLGLIPGVGAIYNGQYAKGLIHVVVLGTLISIIESGTTGAFQPLFGLLIALWFFYMAFEAYHTASKRLRGEPVDEFSSLLPSRSPRASSVTSAIVLILLGGLFLTLNLRPDWAYILYKLWPLVLIAAGIVMLVSRWRGRNRQSVSEEVRHEGL